MEDTGKCNRMTGEKKKKNQSVAKSRPQHGKYPANLWETNKVTQKIITEVITSKDSSTSYWITGLVSFSQACANFIFKMPVYVYTQTNKKINHWLHYIWCIFTLCSMMATKTISWTLVWEVEAAAPNATPSAAGEKKQNRKVQ